MGQAAEPDHDETEQVSFELEHFALSGEGQLELSGRWYGVRGRRFVRPTLTLLGETQRTRLLADLVHKPWAALDGELWLAAFPLEQRPSEAVAEVELAVATDIAVTLDPPSELAEAASAPSHRRGPSARAVAASGAASEEAEALRFQLASIRERLTAAETERNAAQSRRDAAVQKTEALIEELDAATAARERAEAERDDADEARETALRERDQAIQAANAARRERDEALAEGEKAQRARREAHEGRREAVEARDRLRAERDAIRAELVGAQAARDDAVKARDHLAELRELTETEAKVVAPADSPLLPTPPAQAQRRAPHAPALLQESGLAPSTATWVRRGVALVVLLLAIVIVIIIIHSA